MHMGKQLGQQFLLLLVAMSQMHQSDKQCIDVAGDGSGPSNKTHALLLLCAGEMLFFPCCIGPALDVQPTFVAMMINQAHMKQKVPLK